jgi:hypothetical protein
MTNEQQAQRLQKNWDSYVGLVNKIDDDDDRKQKIIELITFFGERLVFCPSDPRTDAPGCKPGGLIEQALLLTKAMKKLNDTFSFDVPTNSIIIVGLLHEIGKLGTLDSPYFLEENESWKRDKLGSYYKINESLSKMTVQERTIFLLQSFGVNLTEDEFLAIRGSSRTPEWVENRLAPNYEPMISTLLRCSRELFIKAIVQQN